MSDSDPVDRPRYVLRPCNKVTRSRTLANRSKSVRIFAEDNSALEELTRLLRRRRAEVGHEALAEYLAHHREGLTQLHEQGQTAIAAGDLAALAGASAAAREAEVDAIMADMPV